MLPAAHTPTPFLAPLMAAVLDSLTLRSRTVLVPVPPDGAIAHPGGDPQTLAAPRVRLLEQEPAWR